MNTSEMQWQFISLQMNTNRDNEMTNRMYSKWILEECNEKNMFIQVEYVVKCNENNIQRIQDIFYVLCIFSGSVLFKLSHVPHISDKNSPFLRVVKH